MFLLRNNEHDISSFLVRMLIGFTMEEKFLAVW
jgi:hypothetical protein